MTDLLHDWDEVSIRVDWARHRSITLFLYCLAHKFKFLNKIKYIAYNTKKIELEKLDYMETLIRLDKLLKIKSIFGIRDNVNIKYAKDISVLKQLYSIDVRKHIHIGEPPDINRMRYWYPSFCKYVSMTFEDDYIKGLHESLGENEIPVFHVDYPYHFKYYIKYLYETMELNKYV